MEELRNDGEASSVSNICNGSPSNEVLVRNDIASASASCTADGSSNAATASSSKNSSLATSVSVS